MAALSVPPGLSRRRVPLRKPMTPEDLADARVREALGETGRCEWAQRHEGLRQYHDDVWGERPADDSDFFERMLLEIFHAGLSWTLIWNKHQGIRHAYDGFDIDAVAAYGSAEHFRACSTIQTFIRSERKIVAAIVRNARTVQEIQERATGPSRAFCSACRKQERQDQRISRSRSVSWDPVRRADSWSRLAWSRHRTTPTASRPTAQSGQPPEEAPLTTVALEDLRRFGRAALATRGVHAADAALVIDVMLEQDLRDHGHHGIVLLALRIRDLDAGRARADAQVELLADLPAFTALDAHGALGPVGSVQAMDCLHRQGSDAGSGHGFATGYAPLGHSRLLQHCARRPPA